MATAIASLLELARGDLAGSDRLYERAAELAANRAALLDRAAHASASSGAAIAPATAAATAEWERAYELATTHAPPIARAAARVLLARAGHDAAAERRWIDAMLATGPAAAERAELLVRRADTRRRAATPDVSGAIADLREALSTLTSVDADADPADADATDPT